jgi:hypothetical protein
MPQRQIYPPFVLDDQVPDTSANLPSTSEKTTLSALDSDGTIQIRYSTADVSNPPTGAELDAAFGTPADVGAGWIAILNDNGAGANVYLILSDGSNWWYVALTRAL